MTTQPEGLPPDPPDLLPEALKLGALGFRVFPIKPRSKASGLWRWQDRATSDPDEIRTLWAQAERGSNLAIRMGAEIPFADDRPGILVAFDVDERTAFRGSDAIAELEKELGPLPETAIQLSGSQNGSKHILLVVPTDCPLDIDDIAPGVLLKAANSYIVGPNSIHPDSGLLYGWELGLEPETVGIAWMPPAWVSYLRKRWERRRQESEAAEKRRAERGDQDSDRDFHGTNLPEWPELLTEFGATPVGTKWVQGEAYQTWLRPAGQDPPTSPFSAALLDGGLYVYSTSWPTERGGFLASSQATGRVYSRVGFFTAVTQGSTGPPDFQAARELARARYGTAKVADVHSLLGASLGSGEPWRPTVWQPAGAVPPQAQVEDDDYPESWRPVDLDPILAGDYQAPTPTLLYRTDGVGLFYRGAVNGIHGESGIGKSWIAVMAAKAEMTSGRGVLILDYEDTAVTMVDRLRRLGVSDDAIRQHLIYIRPTEPITARVLDQVCELIVARGVSLVGLDSVGEALAVEGLNEDRDNEVAPWNRYMPRRLAETGAAVLLVDHGTKAGDRPLHPSGSKRKRAAFTGSSFYVNSPEHAPLGKAHGDQPHEGKLRLTTAKDRHGTHLQGKLAAEIRVVAQPDGSLTVDILPPADEAKWSDPDFITVVLCAQAAVNACREEDKPLTLRALEGLMKVKARAELKRGGIELAVSRGALDEQAAGNRRRIFRYLNELPINPTDPT